MKKNKVLFVSGIGTDVGKTVASAILAQALHSNYWKPIQAGDLDNTDSMKVKRYCSEQVTVLSEKYRLKTPMSPHAAAKIDEVQIGINDFNPPSFDRDLIVEGAGGLMVPINEKGELIIDVLEAKKWPVILVSRHYLGSINHTLLSVDALKKRNIPIVGILYIGDENSTTESIIEKCTNVPVLGRIPIVEELNKSFVQGQAELINQSGILKKGLKEIYE